jgi:hypothetical protein
MQITKVSSLAPHSLFVEKSPQLTPLFQVRTKFKKDVGDCKPRLSTFSAQAFVKRSRPSVTKKIISAFIRIIPVPEPQVF